MDVDEMLAREAIRFTISRYNSAADRGSYEELKDVFTEDAVMGTGANRLKGRQAIIEGLHAGGVKRGAYLDRNFQRSSISSGMINVETKSMARSVHYIIVTTELGVDHTGVYVDRFIRDGNRWLISQRVANMEWVRDNSRFRSYPGTTTICSREDLDLNFDLLES